MNGHRRHWRSAIAVAILALHPFVSVLATPRWAGCFDAAANLHGVPADLLRAVARVESAYNPDALSTAGAIGVMQIRWPITAQHLGVDRPSELFNPCLNIELGARYLKELLDRYGGSRTYALAAYNYGPGRISQQRALPEGALQYVQRVESFLRVSPAPSADNPGNVQCFDSEIRATAYAHALWRLKAIRLRVEPGPDGRWMLVNISRSNSKQTPTRQTGGTCS